MPRKIFIISHQSGWDVRLEGMPEYLSRHASQGEAMEAARRYAGFYNAEIRIIESSDDPSKRRK
jgi:hypothetical protein